MAPEMRRDSISNFRQMAKRGREAAVMALFYPDPSGLVRLLLIKRPSYPGVHSDQVAFPGGKREPGDTDLLATALRETQEEVGVTPDAVLHLRPLSPLYIPPSNFTMSPFVGMAHEPPEFRLQASEVADIIEVPLAEVLDEASLGIRKLTTSYATQIEVPVFLFGGQVVWGATAMVLNELKTLLRQSF